MRRGEDEGRMRLLSLLPKALAAEIYALSGGKEAFFERMEELRLRAPGRCSLVIRGTHRVLKTRVDAEALSSLVVRLSGGARYAYEDHIASGYLPFEGGIRIGICGRAFYERDTLRGVGDISALVIRFPHAHTEDAAVLEEAFFRAQRGLLIYAPPGVGKTTALRTLSLALGTRVPPLRVVVIDERLEFCPEDYAEATVDILRGYHRVAALEIAHRSMNPEVVIMDEIGGAEEARSLSSLLRGGAIAVATAHARDARDLYQRGALRPFFEREAFDVFLRLYRENSKVSYEIHAANAEEGEKKACFAI